MATTSRGIPLADGDTIVNPIQSPLNAMANALDAALGNLVTELGPSIGWRRVGTNADRLALAAPALARGVQFYCTDTDREWEYSGSAWYCTRTPFTDLTYATGWSTVAGAPGAYFRIRGGIVTLGGRVSGTGAAGTTIATLPAEARPAKELTFQVYVDSVSAWGAMRIGTDGAVAFYSKTTPLADVRLDGAPSWTVSS
jgi:hypothetical protein